MMPKLTWKPGDTPYKDFIDKLTPEEYEAHIQKRKKKKEHKKLKDEMDSLIQYNKQIWLSSINNAFAKALVTAEATNDIDTVVKIYDRLIDNKRDFNVDLDIPLPWNDDLS